MLLCVSEVFQCDVVVLGARTDFPCLLQDQDAEDFRTKVNNSGGNFELYIYEDAGHAFLTAESHRDSKNSPHLLVPIPRVALLHWAA